MNIQDLIDRLEVEKKTHGNIEIVSENATGDLVDLRIKAFPLLDDDNNEGDWMLLVTAE